MDGPVAVIPVALEFLTFASTQKVLLNIFPRLQCSVILMASTDY